MFLVLTEILKSKKMSSQAHFFEKHEPENFTIQVVTQFTGEKEKPLGNIDLKTLISADSTKAKTSGGETTYGFTFSVPGL